MPPTPRSGGLGLVGVVERRVAPRDGSDGAGALEIVLRDLGPQVQRGGLSAESLPRCPTRIPEVDRLLQGGFPRGRVGEIAGPRSSGRTSLALRLLSAATTAGECTAWIDLANCFDPNSAVACEVELSRVLWVRPPGLTEALQCVDRLLRTEGFALVILDAATLHASPQPIATASWLRLRRTAACAASALVILSETRLAGTFSDLSIELEAARTHFTGTPALLEGMDTRIALVRSRGEFPERSTRISLLRSARAA